MLGFLEHFLPAGRAPCLCARLNLDLWNGSPEEGGALILIFCKVSLS